MATPPCIYVVRGPRGGQIGPRFKTRPAAVKWLRKVNAKRAVSHKSKARLKKMCFKARSR